MDTTKGRTVLAGILWYAHLTALAYVIMERRANRPVPIVWYSRKDHL